MRQQQDFIYNLVTYGDAINDQVTTRTYERIRRSERVLLRIPIEVAGKEADGRAFTEKTFTLVLNRNGARIVLKTPVRPNDRLTVTNLHTKVSCPFRVIEQAKDTLGEGSPEWGVECLEPEVEFWAINFPQKRRGLATLELVDALLECSDCHSRELAQLMLEQYRDLISQSSVRRDCAKCGTQTDWSFGFVEVGPEEVVPSQTAPTEPSRQGAERRCTKRITVKLPVRVRLEDGREEIARTENLSKTGVCFASDLVMAEGDIIRLTVGYAAGGSEDEVPARIVWRKPVQGSSRRLYGVRLEEVEEN